MHCCHEYVPSHVYGQSKSDTSSLAREARHAKIVKWFRKLAAGQSITDEQQWRDGQKEATGAA